MAGRAAVWCTRCRLCRLTSPPLTSRQMTPGGPISTKSISAHGLAWWIVRPKRVQGDPVARQLITDGREHRMLSRTARVLADGGRQHPGHRIPSASWGVLLQEPGIEGSGQASEQRPVQQHVHFLAADLGEQQAGMAGREVQAVDAIGPAFYAQRVG